LRRMEILTFDLLTLREAAASFKMGQGFVRAAPLPGAA
jgi:hypothetical protein